MGEHCTGTDIQGHVLGLLRGCEGTGTVDGLFKRGAHAGIEGPKGFTQGLRGHQGMVLFDAVEPLRKFGERVEAARADVCNDAFHTGSN